MKRVFVDSHYWIAVTNPNDQWAEAAKLARDRVEDALLVTCDEVLSEFLTGLSKGGTALRKKTVQMVNAILDNSQVEVINQSRESFMEGLKLFEQRGVKEYSFVDCVSMAHMRKKEIQEALTHDNHFTQERFIALMKNE
jgi:predicted nucleic acid-binding protein